MRQPPRLNYTTSILIAFVTQPGNGWIGRWAPGIGDPSLMGWLTVLLYAACAWQCWRTARVLPAEGGLVARERWLWRGLAIAFGGLCINKQLDLQTALTELGRSIAFRQGWYEQRGLVQVAFVLMIAVGAVVALLAVMVLMWNAARWTRVAILGAALVAAFVVIRAASFHHVDRLLVSTVFGLRFNWIVEMSGIATVLFAARRRRLPFQASAVRRGQSRVKAVSRQ